MSAVAVALNRRVAALEIVPLLLMILLITPSGVPMAAILTSDGTRHLKRC